MIRWMNQFFSSRHVGNIVSLWSQYRELFFGKVLSLPLWEVDFLSEKIEFPSQVQDFALLRVLVSCVETYSFLFYFILRLFHVVPAMAHLNSRRHVLYVHTFIRFIKPRLNKLTSHTENKWSSVIFEVFIFIFVVWFLLRPNSSPFQCTVFQRDGLH